MTVVSPERDGANILNVGGYLEEMRESVHASSFSLN